MDTVGIPFISHLKHFSLPMILKAVWVILLDKGYDTDTNAAVYGQIAGAYYGYKAVPKRWTEKVQKGDFVLSYTDSLLGNPSSS